MSDYDKFCELKREQNRAIIVSINGRREVIVINKISYSRKLQMISLLLALVIAMSGIVMPSYAESNVFIDEFDSASDKAKNAFYSENVRELYTETVIQMGDGTRATRKDKDKEGIIIYELDNVGAIWVRGIKDGSDVKDFSFSYSVDNSTYKEMKSVTVNAGKTEHGYNCNDYFFAGFPRGKLYFKITIPVEGESWNKQLNFVKIEKDAYTIIEKYDEKLLTSFNFNAAEDEFYKITEEKTSEEALRLSYALEIMNTSLLAEERLDTYMKRGEFAYAMTNLMRLGEGSFSYGDSFKLYSDVNSKTDYAYNIQMMSGLGFFDSVGDGSFRADEAVSEIDAIYAVLSLLGYKEIMKKNNTNSIYAMAKRAGLKYTANGGKLTVERAAMLFMATVNAKMANKNWIGEIYVGSGTYLEDVLKVKKIIGQVSYTRYGSLGDADYDEINIVEVDGNKFYTKSDYLQRSIGKYIYAYVKNEDDKETVLAFGLSRNAAPSIELTDEDIDNVVSTVSAVRYYDENGRKYDKNLNITKLIINGEREFDISSNKIYSCNKIVFIDGDGDDIYDTVVCEKYTDYFVRSVFTTSKGISDKDGNTIYFDDSVYSHINYINNGVASSFLGIEVNSIVSVAEGKNKRFLKVVISTETQEGSVERVNQKKGTLRINNKEYYLSETLTNKINSGLVRAPQAGDDGTFYLNGLLQISAFDAVLSVEKYGFLIACATKKGLSEALEVKMFTDSGEIVRTECTSKLTVAFGSNQSRVNGKQAQSLISSSAAMVNNGKIEGLIRYRMNSDGKITFISIPKSAGDEMEFSLDYNSVNACSNGSDLIDNKYAYDSNTIRFYIPFDRDETDRYSNEMKLQRGYKNSQYQYNVSVYDANSVNIAAAIVLYERENESFTRNLLYDRPAIVSGKMVSYNDFYEDKKNQLEIITSNKTETYFVSDNLKIVLGKSTTNLADVSTLTYDDLGLGDFIQYGLNAKGEIEKIVLYYDSDYNSGQGRFYKFNGSAVDSYGYSQSAEYTVSCAEVMFVNGNFIRLDTGGEKLLNKCGSAGVTVYDRSSTKNSVYIGKIGDIEDKCKVVTMSVFGNITDMLVIK